MTGYEEEMRRLLESVHWLKVKSERAIAILRRDPSAVKEAIDILENEPGGEK